ncbi:hypothetical protein ACIRCZ_20180 [Leifsonia sp. NPDC102414]|uniref:hypothetical protein n=2 Tax=Actinomycetes TaxID=1760 RepID=UPI0037F9F2EA
MRDRLVRTERVLRGVGAVAVVAVLATGCSPPELPLVAVGRGPGGDLRAVLRPCSDASHMEEVSIWHVANKSGRVDPGVLDGWSARPPQSVTGEQEISLYRPPRDWHGKARSAKVLSPVGFYAVEFVIGKRSVSDGDVLVKYSGINYFKVADIGRLAPGQWWVDGKVMNRTQFRDHADDAC